MNRITDIFLLFTSICCIIAGIIIIDLTNEIEKLKEHPFIECIDKIAIPNYTDDMIFPYNNCIKECKGD